MSNEETVGITSAQAVDHLSKAFHADHDYAWSWHCNVAVAAMDEGVPHAVANRGAARFMKTAFNIDVSKFQQYAGIPAAMNEEVKVKSDLSDSEKYDRSFWQEGIAGIANVVSYDGEDIRPIVFIENAALRAQVIRAHNESIRMSKILSS